MHGQERKTLDVNDIDDLLVEISKDNFRSDLNNYDATLGNRISKVLGDNSNSVVNESSPAGGNGSDLLLVLMYQNLLLARRVAKLEESNNLYY